MKDVLAKLFVASVLFFPVPVSAQGEFAVEVASRGKNVRALLLKPERPVASVILLAGGHGKLDLSADGKIGWGARNQLVRTRAAYAQAGLVTLVPDIAPDMKTRSGVTPYYRVSLPHARDLGALVKYLRKSKAPVVIVGTSRGAVSAANAVSKLSGDERPDGLVLTAPMLMAVDAKTPSVQMASGSDPKRLQVPLLVVGHKKDRCRYTLPSSIEAFRQWHAGKVDVVMMDGGAGKGDPCEAQSAHGFAGIDGEVVAAVSGWIQKLPR